VTATFVLQIIVTGLVTGSIYMLIALGITLLFGIMRVVNFVHGELCMLSAFAVYFVSVSWGMPFLVGVLAAIVFSSVVAVLCQKLLFKPLIPTFDDPTRAWLVLAMASTLAGNFTLLGSIANLIVAEKAARRGVVIGFWAYFRVGAPVTVMTLVIGVLWLGL